LGLGGGRVDQADGQEGQQAFRHGRSARMT
jgi:hypothetical protein